MKHQIANAPVLQPMGQTVGELQEKWKFPSDHLPIGMTFDGFNLASWNILDAEYMSWVTENSQGLSRSQIADEHVYIGNSNLTIRDQHVADLVLQMISHETHPRSLLALQECSEPFLAELRSRLPDSFEIISSYGDAILIDRRRFEILEAKEVAGIFKDTPKRSVQDIQVRRIDNGEILRLVNVHLPGDPTKPGRFEFAEYLNRTFHPGIAMIALGDMNFNELEMDEAMSQAFQNDSPFSIYSPYCTNISPYVMRSKAIDHFFVYSPNQPSLSVSSPDQLMPGLAPIVDLLQKPNFRLSVSKKPADPIADFAQKNCLNQGTLKKTRDYVYLKLKDGYLTQIFNKIKETNPDVRKPDFHGQTGPHISIIRHDEWKGVPLKKIAEIGNRYLFNPVRVDVIETAHKRLWVLVVEPSQELAELRIHYADGDLPHGQRYHVTLAQENI